MRWWFWMVVRLVLTFASAATIYHLIRMEGYRVELGDLMIATACVVLVIKVWSFHTHEGE
jgi:hypothetical protein